MLTTTVNNLPAAGGHLMICMPVKDAAARPGCVVVGSEQRHCLYCRQLVWVAPYTLLTLPDARHVCRSCAVTRRMTAAYVLPGTIEEALNHLKQQP